MLGFFASQAMTYLILVCPGSIAYRAILLLVWIGLFLKSPCLSLLASAWQCYSLAPRIVSGGIEDWFSFAPIITLHCDQKFWFICSSPEANLFVIYLETTQVGLWAGRLRELVETRCLEWDGIWGSLAFSMIMGGGVDGDLKGLYRQLGFLHVLVVSGSQFTILSRWLELILTMPVRVLYAATLVDWRHFRQLKLLSDFALQLALLVYLIACGATPPCQRAFLEHSQRIVGRWCRSPSSTRSPLRVLALQALIFPQTWFSLSNALSWGAILCLRTFGRTKSMSDQCRASLAIQLLSLALFGRMSLSALYLDFLIAPLWEFILLVSLSAIMLRDLGAQEIVSDVLGLVHSSLVQLDNWQTRVFGSSLLMFRQSLVSLGRVGAGLLFIWVLREKFAAGMRRLR